MPENISITINKKRADDLEIDLIEAVVDTDLYMPAMFSLLVKDELDPESGKLKYADSDEVIKLGTECKIEIETDQLPDVDSAISAQIIFGEITAIEPSFSADGVPILQVRGYDLAHRLTQGQKTRTYGDGNPNGSGVGLDQIVKTIAGEDGLSSDIDTSGISSIKYHYVMQYNQTDYEFLWARARAVGYQIYVDEKKIYFHKADAHRGTASDKPGTLTWPINLSEFNPRLSLMDQVQKGNVYGWDASKKSAIQGTATSDSSNTIPTTGWTAKGSAAAKTAFSSEAESVEVATPVSSIDEAKAMALALLARAESEYIRADGACRQGDPRLIAGRQVEIAGVGSRFAGTYYVTHARHLWSRGSYKVSFAVTGRNPETLSFLLNGGTPTEQGIDGVVTAKVTSIEDPENLGRVRVAFGWLPKYKDAELASNWARLATGMGGKERGIYFLPEIDDEVLVAFEHGDVNCPYIVGVLWNNKDKPPEGTTSSPLGSDKKTVAQRIIRSRTGHLIVLDDTDGKENIVIKDKTGKNSITLNCSDNSVTIVSDGDLTLDAGGKLILKAKGDVSMETGANATIKAQSKLTMEATSNASLKGMQLALEGSTKVEIKSVQVKIAAQAQAEIAAQGMLALKSSGIAQLQGTLVKIN